LAQRVKTYGGEILCNGEPVGKSFRALSAFVQQDDVMMGNLTVREVLRYAALLRLPSYIPIKEKLKRIDDIMDELGLTTAADTKVGVPGIRKGISGGERKRLAIGIELLTEPSVLFLDEPTTGLDAKTALNVMETIKKIAQNGRTVILTIHQPRSDIFTLFDGLLLLARGKTAYMGNAHDAKQYFANLDLHCPELYNPADYFSMFHFPKILTK
jgi:ABC-type multidrug transport system ATPase subunit